MELQDRNPFTVFSEENVFRVNMDVSQNCPQTVNGNISYRIFKPIQTV